MTEQEKLDVMADFTIYIENNGLIYNNVIVPVCNNLARKKYKGICDDEKSKKAWYNVVNYSLQHYYKNVYQKYYVDEYGYISAWHYLLNTSERRQVADELQAFYADDIDFLTDRLIKEHERPSFTGIVKVCKWQRNDINGNATYKVIVVHDDNGDIVTGTSQDAQCFNGWLEGKKVKAFYHVTAKRKAVKFDEFQLL
jgi:hypothetical protein